MKDLRYPIASVHGRFQPLHYQHLEYLLEAKKRCDFLWIGITQFDIRALQKCSTNLHRGKKKNNPFTYFERISMIQESLINNGVDAAEFSFLPFPLEYPTRLKDFLPLEIPIFTTICDRWNKYKIELLENCGYQVIVLFKRSDKIIRGEEIRSQIVSGSTKWEDKVPQSSVDLVYDLQIKKRIEEFSS